MRPPVALSIAGSDSSGGAGIQADLKSFSALGAYGMTVIVALTAQNTVGVTDVLEVPASFVTAQMEAVRSDIRIDTVKVGMVASAELARTVAEGLQLLRKDNPELPIVVDPVMVATSGAKLISDDAVTAVREMLGIASIITPNLPEAAELLGQQQARSVDDMASQALALQQMGCGRVLVKGGHGSGMDATDVFLDADGTLQVISAHRVETSQTHGTGCSLSSAIAALRPQRDSWETAVRDAKVWLTGALEHADELEIGQGSGPVHHFYRWW